jgi:hypothetical protein
MAQKAYRRRPALWLGEPDRVRVYGARPVGGWGWGRRAPVAAQVGRFPASRHDRFGGTPKSIAIVDRARARRGVGYSPLARSALTGHEARVREPSSSVPKYSELIWPTLEAIQGPSDIRPSRPHPECVGVAPAHRIG